jgi:hypothetical protein
MTHYENDFINTKIKNIYKGKSEGWNVSLSLNGERKTKSFSFKKYGIYQAKIKALKQLEEWKESQKEERQERKNERERKKHERRKLYNIPIVTSYLVDCSGICDICDEEYSICVCRFEWRK